jgi:hypothetical protein
MGGSPLNHAWVTRSTRTVRAGLVYFGLVFGAGFLLGMIRVPLVVPRLGERTAELLEMPVMFAVILLAARFVLRRHAIPAAAGVRLAVGFIALACLLAVEVGLATLLQERALADYIASRDPVSGRVYLAMLGVLALMPLMLAWQAHRQPDPVGDARPLKSRPKSPR